MMLLSAGVGCASELLFNGGDPTMAELVVHVLPMILRGCELARRLEAELPRISSQRQLLLSCQQIAAVFGEAASSLMLAGLRAEPTASTSPPHDLQHFSPVSMPDRWHINSLPTNLHQQHKHPPTMPQYHHHQSSPPISPQQCYHYAAASSPPTSPPGTFLGMDDLMADVDLDFLGSEEFNLGGLSSPEDVYTTAGDADGQYSSTGSVDLGSAVVMVAGEATEFGRGGADDPVGVSGVPSAAAVTEETQAADGNVSKPCPPAEASCRQRLSKKRKDAGDCTQTRTIRLPAPRTGDLEAPPDDGYAWRKYGHKDILHARFPRCYYRCINKSCCDAKKQVQRLDHDPFTYEITYYGHHTCRASPEDGASGQQVGLMTPASSTSDLQSHPQDVHVGEKSIIPAIRKVRRQASD